MEQNTNTEVKASSLIKSVIAESKKIREQRGDDFFSEKKPVIDSTSKILEPVVVKAKDDFKTLRDSHVKLAHLIVEYDKKIFDQNNQVLTKKKPRSKSVHLYIDEEIEHFLNAESKKASTHWGLRKNAGLGSLIQKFILNFMELKKREEKQVNRIKKVIDEFRAALVEFKKSQVNPEEYLKTEAANQRMKALSSDLAILITLLEFEDESLKKCLGEEIYKWVDFMYRMYGMPA